MSSWQVREVNTVLEEGGEQEWVFTLRHTDQVTEDVSVGLFYVLPFPGGRFLTAAKHSQ